jgi:hypothetical protein
MSAIKEIVFDPIDYEEQAKQYPVALNYETKVMEMVNGRRVPTDDETGFISTQYCTLAPKEIKKDGITIATYESSQRNYLKVPIDPKQKACVELEQQINAYDDALDANRGQVFGKYGPLYTHVRGIKVPKEADELDKADPSKPEKEKLSSVKMRLEMGWNYYYEDKILNDANSSVIRNAFFNAKKKKQDPKSVTVQLTLTDDEGNEIKRNVKIEEVKQTKDKVLTMIMHRRPESIPSDAKEVEDCSEEELVQYYGKGELVKINTADDIDEYYKNGCHIRLVYKPLKVYAQRKKNGEGKRNCSFIFEIKLIDIVNTKQKNVSTVTNKQYENYKFGRGKSSYNESVEVSSVGKSKKQIAIEHEEVDAEEADAEEVDGEEVDGEEAEADGEEQEEEEDEEEVVVETKPVTKTRAKVVVVEEPKTKVVPRKTK